MWWGLFRLLMGGAVLGCIASSATFAFEFGWTRGETDTHRWTFALAGVALDLVKSGLPIFGAQAWHEQPRASPHLLAGLHGAYRAVPMVRLRHHRRPACVAHCHPGGGVHDRGGQPGETQAPARSAGRPHLR